jgi:hypothetical protein
MDGRVVEVIVVRPVWQHTKIINDQQKKSMRAQGYDLFIKTDYATSLFIEKNVCSRHGENTTFHKCHFTEHITVPSGTQEGLS